VTGNAIAPGTPVELFRPRVVGGTDVSAGGQYDVAADGRFLVNVSSDQSVTTPITLLLNWKQ